MNKINYIQVKLIVSIVILGSFFMPVVANECGATGGAGQTITCSGNTYVNGINYYTPTATPISPTVLILNNPAMTISTRGVLVGNQTYRTDDITVFADHFTSIITTAAEVEGRGIMVTTRGDATVNVTGGLIETSGATVGSNAAIGVLAEVFGTPLAGKGVALVTLNGTTINTISNSAAGVMAKSGIAGNAYEGASIIIDNSTISTLGASANGVRNGLTTVTNTSASAVTFRNSTITTQGNSANGLDVQSQAGVASVTVDETSQITTHGNEAHAIRAYSNSVGSVLVSNEGTLTANDANGIHAIGGDGGIAVYHSGAITSAYFGVYAEDVGTGAIHLVSSGQIASSNASGVFIRNNQNSNEVVMDQTTGIISGATHGVFIESNSTSNTTVNIAGEIRGGTDAGLFITGTAQSATIDVFDQGVISSASGVAIQDDTANTTLVLHEGSTVIGDILMGGGSDTVVVSGAVDISGVTGFDSGDVLGVGDTNTFLFTHAIQEAEGARIVGFDTVMLNHSTLTLSDGYLVTSNEEDYGLRLTSNSLLRSTQAFDITGHLSIDPTSMLSHANGGTILGNVVNSGGIYWENLGKTLLVNGDYQGSGTNAYISLETTLGDDSSQTDRLHITGNTTGTTAIAIRPTMDSLGGETIHGIRIVQVDGTSALSSFILAGPVQVGAYEYLLKQGNTLDANDWYLISTYDCSLVNNCPIPLPSEPTGPIVYRPGVANYLGSQYANKEQGFTQLSTLHQRVGEQKFIDENERITWRRPYYLYQKAKGNIRFGYESHMLGIQLGQEIAVKHNPEDSLTHRTAVTFDYAHSDVDFSDYYRPIAQIASDTGTMRGKSIGIGMTHTLMDEQRGYVDLVAQFSILRNAFKDSYADSSKQSGHREAFSIEMGKPIATVEGFWLEPQVQLSYMHTHYQSFHDSISSVDSYWADALRGRIGIRLFNEDYSDTKSQYYGIINILHDFMDPKIMRIADMNIEDTFSKTYLEAGIGLSQQLNATTFFYADARLEYGLDGRSYKAMALNMGIKVAF